MSDDFCEPLIKIVQLRKEALQACNDRKWRQAQQLADEIVKAGTDLRWHCIQEMGKTES